MDSTRYIYLVLSSLSISVFVAPFQFRVPKSVNVASPDLETTYTPGD